MEFMKLLVINLLIFVLIDWLSNFIDCFHVIICVWYVKIKSEQLVDVRVIRISLIFLSIDKRHGCWCVTRALILEYQDKQLIRFCDIGVKYGNLLVFRSHFDSMENSLLVCINQDQEI